MTDNHDTPHRVDLDAERTGDPDYMRQMANDLIGPRPPEHLRPTPEELRARLRAMNANAKEAAANPTAVHSPNSWVVLRVQLERAGLTEADVPWLVVYPTT